MPCDALGGHFVNIKLTLENGPLAYLTFGDIGDVMIWMENVHMIEESTPDLARVDPD